MEDFLDDLGEKPWLNEIHYFLHSDEFEGEEELKVVEFPIFGGGDVVDICDAGDDGDERHES